MPRFFFLLFIYYLHTLLIAKCTIIAILSRVWPSPNGRSGWTYGEIASQNCCPIIHWFDTYNVWNANYGCEETISSTWSIAKQPLYNVAEWKRTTLKSVFWLRISDSSRRCGPQYWIDSFNRVLFITYSFSPKNGIILQQKEFVTAYALCRFSYLTKLRNSDMIVSTRKQTNTEFNSVSVQGWSIGSGRDEGSDALRGCIRSLTNFDS